MLEILKNLLRSSILRLAVSPQLDHDLRAVLQSNREQKHSSKIPIVIAAQVEGIPVFGNPSFPSIQRRCLQRTIVMCNFYIGPAQACNRSFRPPAVHVGEYTQHGRVGILFGCCRTSLVLLLVGGLRFRGVKKA